MHASHVTNPRDARYPFSKLRDESVQGRHAPSKLLHVFDVGGSFHLGNGRDLLGAGFDSTMADDEVE
jgi:hypothetical protein